ncbi:MULTISPECIES: hypothetical protein [unclassified Pseudomonas]|uniref:hypothetical protein n=1 Tax=unclassified Pseudomonas TaxID=196821 RepID=UPI00068B670F|nr:MULTISPECIES: hypothetical protein [unclassified Pseudomonas]OHR83687.1 hypothetical protein HMPREF3289_27225 [Pseudomonas sp. HMSC75E02]
MFSALAIGGLMIGLMLGRLTGPTPGEPHLLAVRAQDGALLLRFDQSARVEAGQIEGALALRVRAAGAAAEGQMRLDGQPLRWRVETREGELWITLLSTRHLGGSWDSEEKDGDWVLRVHPQLR